MTTPSSRDALVADLIDRLLAQRRLLTSYRRAMFTLPRREHDAIKLVRAENRLDEAIDKLKRWQLEQPTSWRNKAALT